MLSSVMHYKLKIGRPFPWNGRKMTSDQHLFLALYVYVYVCVCVRVYDINYAIYFPPMW